MIELYSEGFGYFHSPTIVGLLELTTDILEKYSGLTSPRLLVIVHKAGDPECRNDNARRIISLSATENYYGQWIYQYAHEYLHHLIDGPMEGRLSGLNWFDETLCEAASRFGIWRLGYSDLCATRGLNHACPVLRDYHDNHLPVDPFLKEEFLLNGSVRPWLPLLGD